MEWSKLDAGLAGAVADDDGTGCFAVFVDLRAEAESDDPLVAAMAGANDGPVRTAALTSDEIGRLSERPEVRHIRLSAAVRPAEDP